MRLRAAWSASALAGASGATTRGAWRPGLHHWILTEMSNDKITMANGTVLRRGTSEWVCVDVWWRRLAAEARARRAAEERAYLVEHERDILLAQIDRLRQPNAMDKGVKIK